jgi:hypothetical protein
VVGHIVWGMVHSFGTGPLKTVFSIVQFPRISIKFIQI